MAILIIGALIGLAIIVTWYLSQRSKEKKHEESLPMLKSVPAPQPFVPPQQPKPFQQPVPPMPPRAPEKPAPAPNVPFPFPHPQQPPAPPKPSQGSPPTFGTKSI
ncbi:MAG: hypothetical protein HYT50_01860 [Candidatus Wildermuthbacteria bacterium]|nr:hypothetical protein [Candidatus Wildermuthbacteria bacterium]